MRVAFAVTCSALLFTIAVSERPWAQERPAPAATSITCDARLEALEKRVKLLEALEKRVKLLEALEKRVKLLEEEVSDHDDSIEDLRAQVDDLESGF